MNRLLRAALLTSFLAVNFLSFAAEDNLDDLDYLDGYVGLGGAFVQHLNGEEEGSRQNFRAEFTRIRKWISLDARIGLGQNYTDIGGLFRFYKHWNFQPDSTTGISAGIGVGAMYSQGITPLPGGERLAFVDVIGAPFVRYIWDLGNGVGFGLDLEYQFVPATIFTDDTETDNQEDIRDLRQRIFLGISVLFEIE